MSTSSRKDNDMEDKIKRLLEQMKSGEPSKKMAATMQLAALKREAQGDADVLKRLAVIEQDFKAGKTVAVKQSETGLFSIPSTTVNAAHESSASNSARSSASKNSEASDLSESEQEELAELKASVGGIINIILEKQKLLEKHLRSEEFDHEDLNVYLNILKKELRGVSSTNAFEEVYLKFKQYIDDSSHNPSALLTNLYLVIPTLDTVNDPEGQALAKLDDHIREGLRSTDQDIIELRSARPMSTHEQSLADSMLGNADDNSLLDRAVTAKLSEVYKTVSEYVTRLDAFMQHKKKDKDYNTDDRYKIAVQLCDNLIQVKMGLEKAGPVSAKVAALEKVDRYFTEAIAGATKAKKGEAEAETGPAKLLERGLKSKLAKFISRAPSLIDILADYQKTGNSKIDAGLREVKKMAPTLK